MYILTSNIGQRRASDFGSRVGFTKTGSDANKESVSIIKKELQKTFSPEFINRLDEIIYFNHLTEEDLLEIIDIELSKMYPRFIEIGYKITVTKDLKKKIAEVGYDPKYGARPLKRVLQKYIEDTIAELIINGECEAGNKITLSFDTKKDPSIETPVKVKVTNPS